MTATQEAAQAPATGARRNEKVGQVVSTKMQKTIVVEVSRRVPHPLYKRIIGKRKKFYAHDEEGSGADLHHPAGAGVGGGEEVDGRNRSQDGVEE